MRHPLLERLLQNERFQSLTPARTAELAGQPWSVLLFAGDPQRFPETLDVAVVLPELLEYFPQLAPWLVSGEAARQLQGSYGVTLWPTLVFLKAGQYLGSLPRMQDWQTYLVRIPQILALEPQSLAGRIPLQEPSVKTMGCER